MIDEMIDYYIEEDYLHMLSFFYKALNVPRRTVLNYFMWDFIIGILCGKRQGPWNLFSSVLASLESKIGTLPIYIS